MTRYISSRVAWWTVAGGLAALGGCGEEFVEFGPPPAGSTATTGGGGATSDGGATSVGGLGGSGGGTGGMTCADADMDGVTDCDGDCDDTNPWAHPGAPEVCGDGADNDCDGSGDPPSCNGLGTFVASDVGDDTNPGTQASPVQTIGKGIQNAVTIGMGQPVFVAGGHYTEKVTLVEGVSLLGSYQCDVSDCSWVRDLGNIDTAIIDTDAEGVYAGPGITRATVVEGFRIQGLSSANPGSFAEASALRLDQGSPIVVGNVINGPAVSGCSICGSLAVAIDGPMSDPLGALFQGNEVNAADSPNWSIGISVGGDAVAEILRNSLFGGAGDWARTVTVGGGNSQALIVGNNINAGSCKTQNGSSFALFLGNGEAIVDKNFINYTVPLSVTCNTQTWSGGIEGGAGLETITNNVILGMASLRSTAVMLRDGEVPLGQVDLNSNTLDGTGTPNNNTAISAALVIGPLVQGNNGFIGQIRSNIMVSGVANARFGVLEEDAPGKTLHPAALDTNDIWAPSSGMGSGTDYLFWNGATSTSMTVAQVNAQMTFLTFMNFAADPDLDAMYHLQNIATNPCIDAGTNLGPPPADDVDGDVRPQGADFDVGADEAG
jgi:putative metal-binding protein